MHPRFLLKSAVAVAAALALTASLAPPALAAPVAPAPAPTLTALVPKNAVLEPGVPGDEGGTGTFSLNNVASLGSCDEFNLLGTVDGKSLWIQAWLNGAPAGSTSSTGAFVFTPPTTAGKHTMKITGVSCGATVTALPATQAHFTLLAKTHLSLKAVKESTGTLAKLSLSSVSYPAPGTGSSGSCSYQGGSGWSCNSGAKATVQAKLGGVWKTMKTVSLDRTGKASVSLKPATRTTQYRALVAATPFQTASASASVKVTVKNSVKASLSGKRANGKTTLTLKSVSRAVGAKSWKALSGSKVTFQVKSASKWKSIYTTKLRSGTAKMSSKYNHRSYRALVLATSTVGAATSKTVRR